MRLAVVGVLSVLRGYKARVLQEGGEAVGIAGQGADYLVEWGHTLSSAGK